MWKEARVPVRNLHKHSETQPISTQKGTILGDRTHDLAAVRQQCEPPHQCCHCISFNINFNLCNTRVYHTLLFLRQLHNWICKRQNVQGWFPLKPNFYPLFSFFYNVGFVKWPSHLLRTRSPFGCPLKLLLQKTRANKLFHSLSWFPFVHSISFDGKCVCEFQLNWFIAEAPIECVQSAQSQ